MKPDQLKRWRKEMGLTQSTLAELLGYERWTIMKWEQSKTPVPKWMEIITILIKKEMIHGK